MLNIIDYGCGQGIATLAMLDHIATFNNPKGMHLNIHLIEPSSIALGVAYYKVLTLARVLGFSANITLQHCTLGSAIVPNFDNQAKNLHLMSYILDIGAVQNQLHHITSQIREMSGVQYVIASDIAHSNGFHGLNLLSRQLIGDVSHIKRYNETHASYDLLLSDFANRTARAIGFTLSLDNGSAFSKVA